MADLWKFDITLGQWIWISGSNINYQGTNPIYGTMSVASSSNNPGYRSGSATWTDNAGNLWLFGGDALDLTGTGSCSKNDIWKYNIATNMWTWTAGTSSCYPLATYGTKGVMTSSNVPGGRTAMTFWKDLSGNLWIFGGFGVINSTTTGNMNDLWKYDITANQWVWVSGTNSFNQSGQYNTMGVASTTIIPGARIGAANWVDKNGIFWLHGGGGLDALGNSGGLNDLWKYDPATNQWTWLRGSNQRNQLPVYGSMNVYSSTSQPGAMSGNGCWVDSTGNNFYIGVGGSSNQVNTSFITNILWKYNVLTNQWPWTKGPNVLADQYGIYGTQSVPSFSAIPGGRNGNNSWTGKNGEFYMFGGFGAGSAIGYQGFLNDLWKFNPCYSAVITVTNNTPSTNTVACGLTTVTLSAGSTATVSWFDVYSNLIATGNTLTVPIGTTNTTYLIADNVSCLPTSITVSVLPTPTLNITASNTVTCAGATTTLSAISGAAFTSWSNGSTNYSTIVTPSVTTTYTVVVTNYPWNCSNTGVKTISVFPLPTVSIIATPTTICIGAAVSFTALSSANSYSWNNGSNSSVITVTPGSTSVYSVVATSTATGCKGNNSVTINVNSLPTLTITPANPLVCQGSSITLSALSNASAFSWSSGSAIISTSVSPQVITTYTLLVTDANTGCSQTGITTVSVNTLPSVTILASNATLCAGNSVTLTATTVVNSFSWSKGSANNSIVVSPTNTSAYTVVVTNTATGCSSTGIETITVVSAPTFTIISSTDSICTGTTATLTALSNAQGFSWSTGSNGLMTVVSPSVTSGFSVVVTDIITGCISEGTKTIAVKLLPNISVTISQATICAGESVSLGANGASSYSWSTGGLTNFIHVNPLTTTSYTVLGQGINDCVAKLSIQVIVDACQSVEKYFSSNKTVSIYPNPTLGEFNLYLPFAAVHTSVEIYNDLGQLLYKKELSEDLTPLSLREQASGIYIARAISGGMIIAQIKIVKE
jgi:hypothetical protein